MCETVGWIVAEDDFILFRCVHSRLDLITTLVAARERRDGEVVSMRMINCDNYQILLVGESEHSLVQRCLQACHSRCTFTVAERRQNLFVDIVF